MHYQRNNLSETIQVVRDQIFATQKYFNLNVFDHIIIIKQTTQKKPATKTKSCSDVFCANSDRQSQPRPLVQRSFLWSFNQNRGCFNTDDILFGYNSFNWKQGCHWGFPKCRFKKIIPKYRISEDMPMKIQIHLKQTLQCSLMFQCIKLQWHTFCSTV